ncbi:MAG: D-aminoacyl-tRNA deacylase [Planctomycetes bacterium]|nr:D-aminoacyl-tRNA deacylase [Planctomycetota bacterium]
MRALVQRVGECSVTIGGSVHSRIERGLLVFLCAMSGDSEKDQIWMVNKIAGLRIFRDDAGKMNRSVTDAGGQIMVVSQFTLSARLESGFRPGFTGAMPPGEAEAMYEDFIRRLRERGIHVETGVFGADMSVNLVNDGPVTIWVDTAANSSR